MKLAQRTFAEIEITRARRTDPATSKEAARRAHRLASDHMRKILDVLRASPEPLDAERIADGCGLSSLQVTRRMSELCGPTIAACEVADHDGRTRSNRAASRWRAIP